MHYPLKSERRGPIGLLRIDNPPVNALSAASVAGLHVELDQFETEVDLSALLAHCDGRTYVAGCDIALFDDSDFCVSNNTRLLLRLDRSVRPVVVVNGTAVGGV